MEKKKAKISESVATGLGSSIGAVVGVVGASVIPQEIKAAEASESEELEVEEVVEANSDYQAPIPTYQTQHEAAAHQVEQQPEANDNHSALENQSESSPSDKPTFLGNEVEVMGYETQTGPNGSLCDVAVLSVNGEPVIVGDMNQDGWADVMAADFDGNGQLDQNELVDISSQHVSMEPYKMAYESSCNEIAQNDSLDYINDANVDDYMA